MNKILKTTLLTFIAILGIGFLLVSPVSAEVQPLIVQFQHSPSLFRDADLKPGDIVQGWIKVTNNSGSTQKIDIQAINFHSPIHDDDLSRALSIVIKQGSTDLYGGTSAGGAKLLYDFYNDGETYLSDLANGATVQYDITISFPFDTGNDWQTTTTGFDIKIGFQVAGNNDNGGETGGGGTVTSETTGGGSGGGAGPSEPSIIEGSIQASGCSSVEVNIHWLSTYFSTSQVVYSSQYEPHNFDLNAPNYGYSHATNENLTMVTGHDVKIYGFTAGTTYYYRTISRASLLSISLEHSFVDQQDCQTSGPQQTPPIITPYSTSGGSNPGVLPPLGGLATH